MVVDFDCKYKQKTLAKPTIIYYYNILSHPMWCFCMRPRRIDTFQLVGARPSPCFSFAHHLVGNMFIQAAYECPSWYAQPSFTRTPAKVVVHHKTAASRRRRTAGGTPCETACCYARLGQRLHHWRRCLWAKKSYILCKAIVRPNILPISLSL